MRKLSVFNQVSLDGYFCDAHADMSWAHKHDPEWQDFASSNASGGGALLFGRVTYQMMAGFWTTPAAQQMNAVVAERMNKMEKIVFSKTLENASWSHSRLITGDLVTETKKLKQESGPDMVILGSGSIVAQLTEARLIDEYQLVLNPIVLGAGRTMFERVRNTVSFTLIKTRTFGNGNVVLWYQRRD